MDPTSYKIHPICNLKANNASQGAAANMLTKKTAKVQENDPQSLLAHGTWCMAACAGYSYYAGTDYYGSSRGASTPENKLNILPNKTEQGMQVERESITGSKRFFGGVLDNTNIAKCQKRSSPSNQQKYESELGASNLCFIKLFRQMSC